jgi:flagellar assembly factor FliW
LSKKIATKPFGEMTVEDNQIIDFPDGVLGFDYIKQFALLEEAGSPFLWLQAISEPSLAFVIISPLSFLEEYSLVISQGDLDDVGAKNPEELTVFAIVTIPSDNPSAMTANLQGPIIVNSEKRKGKQAISLSDKYRVRHNIMEEMKKRAGKEV